jgi:hypothetical protein
MGLTESRYRISIVHPGMLRMVPCNGGWLAVMCHPMCRGRAELVEYSWTLNRAGCKSRQHLCTCRSISHKYTSCRVAVSPAGRTCGWRYSCSAQPATHPPTHLCEVPLEQLLRQRILCCQAVRLCRPGEQAVAVAGAAGQAAHAVRQAFCCKGGLRGAGQKAGG